MIVRAAEMSPVLAIALIASPLMYQFGSERALAITDLAAGSFFLSESDLSSRTRLMTGFDVSSAGSRDWHRPGCAQVIEKIRNECNITLKAENLLFIC
jgi:hypothetical protein